MEDKEKSVIYGVVCVVISLFMILFWYLLPREINLISMVFIVLFLPLLAVGFIGIVLKKYWKTQRLFLIITIAIFLAILFIAPLLDL